MYTAKAVVDTHCIICGSEMLIDALDINDMDKHVCNTCAAAPGARIMSSLWYGGGRFPSNPTPGPPAKKCECGAKAGGFQYHAHWCPVYEDPMKPKEEKKDD